VIRVVVEAVDSQLHLTISRQGTASQQPLAPAGERELVDVDVVRPGSVDVPVVPGLGLVVDAVRGVAVFDRSELLNGGVQWQDVLRILGGEQITEQGQPDDLRVDALEVLAKHRVGRQLGIVLEHDLHLSAVVIPELDFMRRLARPGVFYLVSGEDLLARLVLDFDVVVVEVEVGHATIARLADKGLDDAVTGHVDAAGHAVVDHGNSRVVLHEHGAHVPNARHEQVGGGGVKQELDLGLVRKSGRHGSILDGTWPCYVRFGT
jgi:hypothetical protein